MKVLIDQKGVNSKSIELLRQHSYMGEIFATALDHVSSSPGLIKESIEETGRAVFHRLEKYLSTLGTIATVPHSWDFLERLLVWLNYLVLLLAAGRCYCVCSRDIYCSL